MFRGEVGSGLKSRRASSCYKRGGVILSLSRPSVLAARLEAQAQIMTALSSEGEEGWAILFLKKERLLGLRREGVKEFRKLYLTSFVHGLLSLVATPDRRDAASP